MSAFPKNTAVRAGAVAGFLAMAFAGWKLAGDPVLAAGTADSTQATAKAGGRPARAALRHGTPSHVRDRLAGIRAAGSKEDRLRATIHLANSLSVAELAAWMDGRWFDTGDRYELTLFNKIANERWGREDAEGFVTWSLKNGGVSANGILTSWATDDPARLAAYFKEHPNDPMQLQLLAEMAKSHPGMALGGLKEMIACGLPHNVTQHYENLLLREVARSSAGELEAMLDTLPASWRGKIETALVGQRLETSFPEEIRRLWDRPDGWKLFAGSLENGKEVGDELLGELANLPASWRTSISENYYRLINEGNAAKWLEADLEGSGFSAEQAGRLRSGALQRISYRKPEEALRLMGDVELGTREKAALITNIFINAGENPEKQKELLALLGSEEDRSVATNVMSTGPRGGQQTAIEKPSEWLEQAGTVDPQMGYTLLRKLGEWDKETLAELAGQFRAMPDEGKVQVARMIATNPYGGDSVDPAFKGEAIGYLLAQPQDEGDGQQSRRENPIALASQHAVKWAEKDPLAASDWVQALPSGDGKLWAQKNLATNWAQYDPDAAKRWAASLPADARTEVQDFMKNGPRK